MNYVIKNLQIGDFIFINEKYIGLIYKIIWNSNGYIVKLHDNHEYEDWIIKQYNLLEQNDIRGFMLVSSNDKIILINDANYDELLKYFDDAKIMNIMNEIKSNGSNLTNLTNLTDVKQLDINNCIKSIEKIMFLFVSNPHVKWEENFNYKTSNSIDVLGEENINTIIKPGLIIALEKFNEIEPNQYYDLKNTLVYKHLIYDENIDTVSMGKTLIELIKKSLLSIQQSIDYDDGKKLLSIANLFDFLNFKIIGGYVEITNNTNVDSDDEFINNPNFNTFESEYFKHKDFISLSQVILENKTIYDIEKNKLIIDKILDTLSEKYIICFQPDINVLLWTITRIILSWFSDKKLFTNIYKIKILVNLFRARTDKKFNREYGVQPIIQIFPKYGKKNALMVLSHLSYFFFSYKKLGFDGSKPDGFEKIDNLMYWTNASIELEKYIKCFRKL